jgi:hypothetical protein
MKCDIQGWKTSLNVEAHERKHFKPKNSSTLTQSTFYNWYKMSERAI